MRFLAQAIQWGIEMIILNEEAQFQIYVKCIRIQFDDFLLCVLIKYLLTMSIYLKCAITTYHAIGEQTLLWCPS